jgi:hypothetical protein
MEKKHSSKKSISTTNAYKTHTTQKNVIKTGSNENSVLIVKVISILGYIGAGFGILFGLLLLFGGSFILGMMPFEEISQVFGALAGAIIMLLAVTLLLFSIFWIFISRALWNHKNWARIVFIIFAVIGALNSIFTLPAGILSLILDGAIVYFLGFDENVKNLFK